MVPGNCWVRRQRTQLRAASTAGGGRAGPMSCTQLQALGVAPRESGGRIGACGHAAGVRTRGVDADGAVQLALGDAHLHRNAHALHDLGRVGADLREQGGRARWARWARRAGCGPPRPRQARPRQAAGLRAAKLTGRGCRNAHCAAAVAQLRPSAQTNEEASAGRAGQALRTMWQPTTTSLSDATISFMNVLPGLPLQGRQGRASGERRVVTFTEMLSSALAAPPVARWPVGLPTVSLTARHPPIRRSIAETSNGHQTACSKPGKWFCAHGQGPARVHGGQQASSAASQLGRA